MPFKSEAQRKKFHAMAAKGEISQKVVDEWEAETKKQGKKLPARITKTAYEDGRLEASRIYSARKRT